MAPALFGLNIAGIVKDAVQSAGGLVNGTLTEISVGTRSGDLTAGRTQTPTIHTFTDGIIGGYKDSEIDGTTIKKGDRRILIIANTLSSPVEPKANWKVSIEGSPNYRVVDAERDPAAATWTLQVRGE